MNSYPMDVIQPNIGLVVLLQVFHPLLLHGTYCCLAHLCLLSFQMTIEFLFSFGHPSLVIATVSPTH